MAVNYNDERFQNVNREKEVALNNINNTYNNMIQQSDSYYNNLQNQVNETRDKQLEIQREANDISLKKLDQAQEWAKKDYEKEQKAAYVDYQRQIDPHGIRQDNMASMGLTNSGWNETSKLALYNTYQNRVATAKESFDRVTAQYNLGYEEAVNSNNAKLLEIYSQASQKGLELALQGFQYKNSLIQSQLNAQQTTEDRYYNRWKDTLNQINTENALAEQKRQFNASQSNKTASIEKDGLNGLSANAKKMLQDYLNIKSGSSKSVIAYAVKKANTNTIRNVINTLYHNNQITENDVYILADRFGL